MFEPDTAEMPIEYLSAAIVEDAAQIAAATCRKLLNIAELDRRATGNQFWGDLRSTAHFLSWRCGIDLATARAEVRVARRLSELPAIRDAFSKGELSYSQVRLLVRVATSETDQSLCDIARYCTGAQLERMVRSYRRLLEIYADPAEANANRELSYFFDADGYLVIHGRLAPETGRVVKAALDAAAEQLRAEAKRGDLLDVGADQAPGRPRIPAAANRADALVAIAESSLAQGLASRSGSERTQIVVHVDPEVLSGEGPGEHCELEDGPDLAPETARRLACDASLVVLVEDAEGQPLSVGRKTRKISPALARALKARDQGCVFPGCGQSVFVEHHHIEHWAAGGATDLDNLATLCWFHHHLVHEGGYRFERDGSSEFVFTRPNGTVVEKTRPPADPKDADLGMEVDLRHLTTRSVGERAKMDDIVSAIIPSDSRIPKLKTPPEGPAPAT